MKIYKLIVILLVAFTTVSCNDQAKSDKEATTFILVRHAEKASDGTSDPPLTEEGKARAKLILSLLLDADITAIYSTNFKRTKMTVAPLAEARNLEIQSYSPKKLLEFSQQLVNDNSGGSVIISGHSNTTPALANFLMRNEKLKQFDDADYGNFLIITSYSDGNAKLLHMKY